MNHSFDIVEMRFVCMCSLWVIHSIWCVKIRYNCWYAYSARVFRTLFYECTYVMYAIAHEQMLITHTIQILNRSIHTSEVHCRAILIDWHENFRKKIVRLKKKKKQPYRHADNTILFLPMLYQSAQIPEEKNPHSKNSHDTTSIPKKRVEMKQNCPSHEKMPSKKRTYSLYSIYTYSNNNTHIRFFFFNCRARGDLLVCMCINLQ